MKNMLSGDENDPNVAGDSPVPETTTTGGTIASATSANKLPSGSGPGTTGRASLDNLTTGTSGELHLPTSFQILFFPSNHC